MVFSPLFLLGGVSLSLSRQGVNLLEVLAFGYLGRRGKIAFVFNQFSACVSEMFIFTKRFPVTPHATTTTPAPAPEPSLSR